MPRRSKPRMSRPSMDQVQRERLWKRRVDKEEELVAPYASPSLQSCPYAVDFSNYYHQRPDTASSIRSGTSHRPSTAASSASSHASWSSWSSKSSTNSATMARLDRLETILHEERRKREEAEQELRSLRQAVNEKLKLWTLTCNMVVYVICLHQLHPAC